jgi:hypothetical protein
MLFDYFTSNRSVHNFIPSCNKVMYKFFFAIILSIHLNKRKIELEPNTKSMRVAVHLTTPVLRSQMSYKPCDVGFQLFPMSVVHKEISSQSTYCICENTMFSITIVSTKDSHSTY